MREKRRALLVFVASLCLFAFAPVALHAQTASSGVVTGQVTDPSGAIVPKAKVTLTDTSTGNTLTVTTDPSGHYTFGTVPPGTYNLSVTKAGFRKAVVSELGVSVLKSYTVNVKLQVGLAAQTVTVTAQVGAQLQTTNATVGNVINTAALADLPQLSRSATSLMFLQPGVTPNSGANAGNTTTGGQVAGARSDQTYYTIDGGDATSDLEGTSGYSNSYSASKNYGPASSAAVIPIPIAMTQEFRVSTSNANATFSRSAGGEVAVETKRGTNSFHGEVYEYHTDDALGANRWENNFSGVAKPHQVDNRFGANVGGYFLKNRVWFFFGYEGHRFHDSTSLTRLVPTDTLKSGQLLFKDNAGNTQVYSLQPGNVSSNCGTSGTSLCDPRNIGMSPTVSAQLALYPKGNNTTLGDGLNTTGFQFAVPTPLVQDIGAVRMDFKVTNKWSLFGTYHLSKIVRSSVSQVNIVSSPPVTASTNPVQPSMISFQLTGQLTPTLTTVFHGSYTRNDWEWGRTAPAPFVNSTQQALQLAGEGVGDTNGTGKLLTDPINIDTQDARGRIWDGHDWYIADDTNWVHGNHLFQFGASGYIFHDYHLRQDDVLGGVSSGPILFLEATGNGNGTFLNINSTYEPIICTGSSQSGCLPSTLTTRFNQLYASVLGLVDRGAQVLARNGNFQPSPLGTPIFDNVTIPAFYTYFQDTWQIRPSLTTSFGLTWGAQLPVSEQDGKIVFLTGPDGEPINDYAYLSTRAASLEQKGVSINSSTGNLNVYNPLFGLTPTNALPKGYGLRGTQRLTAWHDFGPRLSVAWNVPYDNWFFGHNHNTVIRGGYAILYDRTTSVNQVLSNLLVGGLADVDTCGGPVQAAYQSGGQICSGSQTDPLKAFRIGVDGNNVPLPAPTAEPIPFVPTGSQAAPFGLFLSGPLDPYSTPGWNHNVTFNIQRALPGRMLIEVGYIGRFSRNLAQGLALNAPDYRTKDALSGQTMAQAFDGVGQALRNGTAIPTEPFFEHLLGGASNCQALAAGDMLTGISTCSQYVAAADPSDIINGDLNSFDVDLFEFVTPSPMDNLQMLLFSGVSDKGFSDYNAGFVTAQKAFSNGLQFQFNWTWSHVIGNQGLNQENVYSANSPYNLQLDKSSSVFDRRHVISTWWVYDLPFGQGKRFDFHNAFLNNAFGGWYTSGVWTFMTGLPMCVNADGNYGSFLSDGNCAIAPSSLNLGSLGGATHSAGGGLNLFSNPNAVFKSLQRPLLSQYGQIPFDELRGPHVWNVDLSVGKNIKIRERYQVKFSADFLNSFNHPNFDGSPTSFSGGPSLDLNSPDTFGVYSSQSNDPRLIQFGLDFSF